MSEEARPEEVKVETKPLYKKFKLMCWIAATILNILTLFVGGLTPDTIGIVASVLVAVISVTTQHTITDVKTSVAKLTLPK